MIEQCDLALPGCQKCQRIGKACPGYPNEWDLAFRSENAAVYAKAHRQREAVPRHARKGLTSASSRFPLPKNVSLFKITHVPTLTNARSSLMM
jgi:hypothetical protein